MEASTSGQVQKFKVVLLGEGAVGKTSLVLRYVENKFNPRHQQTLQASFMNKKLNIAGKRMELNIWDTAGQERFHALGPIYYRDSNGAVLVYDITDQTSFNKVKTWVKELRRMLGEKVMLVIAGNKIDLEKDRNVTIQEAQEYAESVGAKHFSTSAKGNIGIEEMFLDLSKRMLERAAEESQGASGRGNSVKRRNVLLVDDEEVNNTQAANSKRCC